MQNITHSDKLDHHKPLFKKLHCMTVINLYIYNIYEKSNVSILALRKYIHVYNTRNCKFVDIPHIKDFPNGETVTMVLMMKIVQKFEF